MAKMMPSMAAVMPSKEAVVTGEQAVNNESFPQATSGDKNWQQSQLSSALEDITPQDVPSISAQGKVNNIERVVPSPSNSTSPASSLQHSPITEPTVVNITNTTEVNLAQSSENASSTTPPAVTL
ncbi:uncharacterized protein LOC111320420, partial [Stylophora pistillata]|uniref:uncharacterized protein LOC111320420 n=1 Tax=Stylophora pistillata TaxID=50429 RepID=UPI000C052C86